MTDVPADISSDTPVLVLGEEAPVFESPVFAGANGRVSLSQSQPSPGLILRSDPSGSRLEGRGRSAIGRMSSLRPQLSLGLMLRSPRSGHLEARGRPAMAASILRDAARCAAPQDEAEPAPATEPAPAPAPATAKQS